MTIDNFPPSDFNWAVAAVVEGEPASKANQRKFVKNRHTGKPMFIKSDKARNYVKMFADQLTPLDTLLEGDLVVAIRIYYASRRPDLDESVILDCLQDVVYANDWQVKQKHIYWGLDKERPRAEIYVAHLTQ